MPRGSPHDPQRDLWGRVVIVHDTGCWVWQGAKKENYYGILSRGGGEIVYAHRYAWELVNGPIPLGLFVCHHCDNPPCINPSHLFVGTHTDNMRDCHRKGRYDQGETRSRRVRGENSSTAILTADAVQDIKDGVAFGLTHKVAGAPWHVGKSAVAHIIHNRNWRHLNGAIASR